MTQPRTPNSPGSERPTRAAFDLSALFRLARREIHIAAVLHHLSVEDRAVAEGALALMTPEHRARWTESALAVPVATAARKIRSIIARTRLALLWMPSSPAEESS